MILTIFLLGISTCHFFVNFEELLSLLRDKNMIFVQYHENELMDLEFYTKLHTSNDIE